MSLARRYLFWIACLLFVFANSSSIPFLACSNTPTMDDLVSSDGADVSDISFSLDTSKNVEQPDEVKEQPNISEEMTIQHDLGSDMVVDFSTQGPQDRPPCDTLPPETRRKQTGSWILGPQALAHHSHNSYVKGLAVDKQGYVVLALDLDYKTYIFKIGADSLPMWDFTFQKDQGNILVQDLQLDEQDNVYVMGGFSNKIVFGSTTLPTPKGTALALLKFSSQGIPLWIHKIQENPLLPGKDIYGVQHQFVLSQQGDVYVAGHPNKDYSSFDNTPFPEVSQYMPTFVIGKYSPNQGKWLWTHAIYAPLRGSGYIDSFQMVLDAKENLYITGAFGGNLQFGTLSTFSVSGRIVPTSNVFVSKMDKQGSFQWVVSVSGGENRKSRPSIVVDRVGNAYIADSLEAPRSFGSLSLSTVSDKSIYVAKLTPNGTFAWAVHAPKKNGNNSEFDGFAHKLHLTSDGSLLLTGTRFNDVFAARFDGNGQWLSEDMLGSFVWPHDGTHPQLDHQDNLYIAGTFVTDHTPTRETMPVSVWSATWSDPIEIRSTYGCDNGRSYHPFLWKLLKP